MQDRPERIIGIDVRGMSFEKALIRLDLMGARGTISYRKAKSQGSCDPEFRNLPEGMVCKQSFTPGRRVIPGKGIELVLAPKGTKLPSAAESPFASPKPPSSPEPKSGQTSQETPDKKGGAESEPKTQPAAQ